MIDPTIMEAAAFFVAAVLLFLIVVSFKKLKNYYHQQYSTFRVGNIKSLVKEMSATKIILASSLLILAAMTVFPPWIESLQHLDRPIGYFFLFSPPWPSGATYGVSIDLVRLLLQWLVVVFTTLGICLCIHDKK